MEPHTTRGWCCCAVGMFDIQTETAGEQKRRKVVVQCKGFFLERGVAGVHMISIYTGVI